MYQAAFSENGSNFGASASNPCFHLHCIQNKTIIECQASRVAQSREMEDRLYIASGHTSWLSLRQEADELQQRRFSLHLPNRDAINTWNQEFVINVQVRTVQHRRGQTAL